MTYNVVLLKEAQSDFKEAFEWYYHINPKLSSRFLLSFKNTLKIIQKNPLLFQIKYDDVRVALLKKFPYLVHFSIQSQTILVKAVFHTSRDSDNWSLSNTVNDD